MNKKQLSEKEESFCFYYCRTKNYREAAALAGYSVFPERSGRRLLRDKRIQTAIRRMERKFSVLPEEAAAGYRRIAYGSLADAVRLLFADEAPSPEEIEKMDLFCVSEIKRPKAGGIEIKFFDRLKALEKLNELSPPSGEQAIPQFFAALENGARAISPAVSEDG